MGWRHDLVIKGQAHNQNYKNNAAKALEQSHAHLPVFAIQ